MELRGLQTDLACDPKHFGKFRVEEHADQRDAGGQGVADGLRLLHRDAAAAPLREDHADLVGALASTEKSIRHGAHATELDLHARTSARVADSGSEADESASPTSSIEAPSVR